MRSVDVGVGEQDDLGSSAASRGRRSRRCPCRARDDEAGLLLGEHLVEARLLDVQHLAEHGQMAWERRSRPCLADPPAESPSTM